VVSDVELLAKDDDLAGAVGKLSDNPHLAIVTALLALFESITSQRLVVNGRLLARGSSGHGISLAVRRRGGIAARGSVWDAAIADPVTAGDPTPYYDLAVPAAAWVQYEAASLLDARVAQITSNAESFAHLGVGLEHHRNGRLHEAAKAYLDALDLDADNVAALANLSLVLAQLAELYFAAIRLLVYARATLERRHREAHAAAS
jgi:tetratricopeptide (TPR) repeat protein